MKNILQNSDYFKETESFQNLLCTHVLEKNKFVYIPYCILKFTTLMKRNS